MKNSKRMISFILCVIYAAGTLSACADNGQTEGESSAAETSSVLREVSEETVEAPDTSEATVITLSDEGITVSGGGAEEENGTVTITAGGTYLVTGQVTEGRLIVNAPEEEVTIVLENAGISCSDNSPLYVYQSLRTTLYLAEGTVNTLTDGGTYTYSDGDSSAVDQEPNACLYSKSDLVIGGSGRLTVTANYNNGITSKDTLKIEGASLTVTAVNHGVNGKDFCVVQNASVEITSGGDALRSTNDSDSTLGYLVITDSSLNLTAGEDGIQAETALTISGGTCKITSGGGSGGSVADDASAKGLKGGTGVSLYEGVYTLDCCDDAIHSNGSVLISGGTYTIATGDDGIHADETVTITEGAITISQSYEGIEGTAVEISGGAIQITASDDGINGAGGADQSGFGPREDFFESDSDSYINISGGVITIDASGDGVDSNGDLTVSGGELYISGPEDNGNGALDYAGTATITGGIVVAAGSSGMAQNFGDSSTQGSILLTYSAFSTEPITLLDSTGSTLVSYTPSKRYNCVVISCPSITTGNTYTVEAGGETSSVTMSSLIYGGSFGMGGGMEGGNPGNPPGGQEGAEPPDGQGGFDGTGEPDSMGGPGGMENLGDRP